MLAIPFLSPPPPNDSNRSIWTIGGTESCAAWLATPASETEGRWWIAGFWSGRNMQNGPNGRVGSSSDSEGIIGVEVGPFECATFAAPRLPQPSPSGWPAAKETVRFSLVWTSVTLSRVAGPRSRGDIFRDL